MKTKIATLIGIIVSCIGIQGAGFCQSSSCCDVLENELSVAKTDQQIYGAFGKARDCFFKENRYNEFCQCAQAAGEKQKNAALFSYYFCALGRYKQLKYLEEQQLWDEYFNKGNEYRDEITTKLDKAIKSAPGRESLAVYARLLLWQFHKDQQDAFTDESLSDLMAAAVEYAKSASDVTAVKDAADILQSYDEKPKSKALYRLYIDKLLTQAVTAEQLKAMAAKFLKDGNLELSQTLYDAFIQKIIASTEKEKVLAELTEIAKAFAYKDEGPRDPAYAEKIFQKIESLFAKDALTEALLYARGYNLEKAKEYDQANRVYGELLSRFPQAAEADKVTFKVAMMYAYALRDLSKAREYLEKLTEKESTPAYVISSLYQLGLLSQWEDDTAKAKIYYTKLLEKAKDNFGSSVTRTKARLKELDDNALLESNLRTFIDMALRPEYATFSMSKVELSVSNYNPAKGQEVVVSSTATPPESGCMHVGMDYSWVGDLGTAAPAADATLLTTAYAENGTKLIGLVVKTPTGIIDRTFEFIDVQ